MQSRDVTEMASGLIEELLARLDISIVDIAAGGNGQSLHIEVYALHIFRRHIEHIIGESHHRTFLHLDLSFTDLLRIAAVGHTHITREAQFHGQIGMMRLIAGESEAEFAAFVDIVTASADAPFGIVALAGKGLYLVLVEGHDLSHADMTQRHTDGTEEILRLDTIRIPLRDSPLGFAKRIFLTIGETEFHRVDPHLQLSLRPYAIDGLIMDHTTVVGEEGAVLTGDVYQRRRESIRAGTVVAALFEVCPVGGLRASRIAVTATTAVSGIDRTETSAVAILIGHLHVVVQTVASIETGSVCP